VREKLYEICMSRLTCSVVCWGRRQGGLFAMFFFWAWTRAITHIYGVANPDRVYGFSRNGFRALGRCQFSTLHGLAFIPIVLGLPDLPEMYRAFAKRHAAHPLTRGSLRQLHVAGETVLAGAGPRSRHRLRFDAWLWAPTSDSGVLHHACSTAG
jgi:hypothetical protein